MSQPPPDPLENPRSRLGKQTSSRQAKRSGGITWGKTDGASPGAGAQLLGQLDPLEGTPLAAGERVAVCQRCGAAYHISTMSFIRQQNRGACVSCRTVGQFVAVLIPAAGTAEVKPERPSDQPEKSDGRLCDEAGRPIVLVHEVRDFINQEVAFEGKVIYVRYTGGGAWFLHFEPGRSALDGFRGVIRRRDLFHWQVEDIDPGRDYDGQWLRLTGKIIDDPQWGLQILLTVPEQVRILDGPTVSVASTTLSSVPHRPRLVNQSAEPALVHETPTPARRPAIRWRG